MAEADIWIPIIHVDIANELKPEIDSIQNQITKIAIKLCITRNVLMHAARQMLDRMMRRGPKKFSALKTQ